MKQLLKLNPNKITAGNIGLAIWRLKCFYETFVQGSTAVILLNFCAKNPPLSPIRGPLPAMRPQKSGKAEIFLTL